ncbi:MAG: hypothetical protein SH868_19745 [Bythopirellula sp.]|nr:hypothetical protein [Bythopirellula sp.]
MTQNHRLKVTANPANDLKRIFANYLVNIAYLIEATDDGGFIEPGELDWLDDPQRYEWMCDIIKQELEMHGITEITFTLTPDDSNT